jgi:hypothetical protein
MGAMTKTPEDWLAEYRNQLLSLEQKSQESYDKTVLTLSTGAFGITFAFVSNFLDQQAIVRPELLTGAWTMWAISAAAVLFSYFFSVLALRRAVTQLDSQKIFRERPGGAFHSLTMVLNAAGGLLFVAGLILTIAFVQFNFVR